MTICKVSIYLRKNQIINFVLNLNFLIELIELNTYDYCLVCWLLSMPGRHHYTPETPLCCRQDHRYKPDLTFVKP